MVRKTKGYNSDRNTIIVRKGKGEGDIRMVVNSFGRSQILERSKIKLPKLHNRIRPALRPADEHQKEIDTKKPPEAETNDSK